MENVWKLISEVSSLSTDTINLTLKNMIKASEISALDTLYTDLKALSVLSYEQEKFASSSNAGWLYKAAPYVEGLYKEYQILQSKKDFENKNYMYIDSYRTILVNGWILLELARPQIAFFEMHPEENESTLFKRRLEEIDKRLELSANLSDENRVLLQNSIEHKYSQEFGAEASDFQTASKKWLYSALTVVVLMVAFAFTLIFCPDWYLPEDPGRMEVFQSIFAKILILSIGSFLISLFSSNYKNCRHNFIINKHRANSLNTVKGISLLVKDNDTLKNAVLIQATNAIFQHQTSGYTGLKNETLVTPMTEAMDMASKQS